jgi:phosphatidylserine/phosphatidylglycerophosphate/cardiolipin synthase-like enzyme
MKIMTIHAWYAKMLVEIAASNEVLLATPWYDHPGVHQALWRKLDRRGREPFALTVLIDRVSFRGRTPPRQKERITALQAKGAKIILCTGLRFDDTFHKKAVIIDRRYLYSGSANITYASDHGNAELVYRAVGQPVLDAMAELAAEQVRGREWTV